MPTGIGYQRPYIVCFVSFTSPTPENTSQRDRNGIAIRLEHQNGFKCSIRNNSIPVGNCNSNPRTVSVGCVCQRIRGGIQSGVNGWNFPAVCICVDNHKHIGETVVTCGLVVEQRTHHQVTGEPMKFLTLADWTGMVETELFAKTYRNYGLATVRYPVLEVTATVEPFENGRGFWQR